MVKNERYKTIMNLLTLRGSITVNDIMEKLSVSDMTIRRDLAVLEEEGLLKRVHGGAIANTFNEELTHQEKQIINIEDKMLIAEKAAELIKEGDTIFLGPGTTIELLARSIAVNNIQIITNCVPVFNIVNTKKDNRKVYLVGGEMRESTQAFVGEIANKILADLKFQKAFFGCNALNNLEIMTSTLEEGQTQTIALDNSQERYLLVDSSKIGKTDFCVYYHLDNVTEVITNRDKNEKYQQIETKDLVVV